VRNLTWSNYHSLEYICLFIGHRTLRIDLQLGLLLVTDQSLLLSLPAAHPNIVHISFTPHDWDDRRECPEACSIISTVFSDIVCGWNHLTYVNIAIPLAPRALLHLRDMPLLHVAQLTLEDSEGFGYLSHPSQSAFIALRELSVSCSSFSSCSAFLNTMPWHHLESIEVNLPSVPYDPADDDAVCMKMFFQVLSAQCSTTSLKIIFLAAYRFMPSELAIMRFKRWRWHGAVCKNWSLVDLAGQVNLGCHLHDWSLWCSIAMT
jgi:hypothetical protein